MSPEHPPHPPQPLHPEGFDDALGASYRLVRKLGEGATGEVWSTEHRRTGETVATKLLRPEHLADRVLIRRFFEERDVLTGLRHHGVVSVRDLVAEGDRLAIVMEYVDGGSLRDVLRSRGPLPPALAVEVAAAVLDGLAAAHEQGVVHRDIKPDNVLLTREWWSLRPGDVKLVDFGIARILTERSRGTTGGLLGTPEYMAPELLTRGVAGHPADVYGVGVLLYELLAGRTPFAGPGIDYTIAHRHVTSEPPPLALPERLDEALRALLAKDPDARPEAPAAAAALRRLLDDVRGLPALPRQGAPAEFEEARGPVTLLRGDQGDTSPRLAPLPDPASPEGAASQGRDFDLGVPSQMTTLRPFVAPVPTVTAADVAPAPPPSRPGWKDPRLITLVAACLVLILGAVLFVTLRPGGGQGPASAADPTPGGSGQPVTAEAQDTGPLPTGLTIARSATFDPQQGTVDLEIEYAAQGAPLTGPFYQVVPGLGEDALTACPIVEWTVDGALDGGADPDTPSTSGLPKQCGWAVDPGVLEPQQPVTATASFELPLQGDSDEELQTALADWLDQGATMLTDDSLADGDLAGAAYPVQRLETINVDVPPDNVTGPVVVRLSPTWAGHSEPDSLVLFRSDAPGDQTEVLTQVAGPDAVRFTDGCGGSLLIGGDGTTVTARTFAPSCTVNARVGNFSDLTSNDFAITTRGG